MDAEQRKEIEERVAALAHEQWSGWMIYLFGKSSNDGNGNCVIPKEWANRWARQVATKYDDLSEEEKESDRIEARKVLQVSLSALDAAEARAKEAEDRVRELEENLRNLRKAARFAEWFLRGSHPKSNVVKMLSEALGPIEIPPLKAQGSGE